MTTSVARLMTQVGPVSFVPPAGARRGIDPGADDILAKAEAAKRTSDPTANALIDAMLPQVLIVFAQRLGGEVVVPVDEIDATGGVNLSFAVEADGLSSRFRFVVTRKARGGEG